MIARLEVSRGTLTEYPLAENTRGGWQNGFTFYPDAEVTNITPVRVVPVEPQGEPSEAQVDAAMDAFYGKEDAAIAHPFREDMRAALRAVWGLR